MEKSSVLSKYFLFIYLFFVVGVGNVLVFFQICYASVNKFLVRPDEKGNYLAQPCVSLCF